MPVSTVYRRTSGIYLILCLAPRALYVSYSKFGTAGPLSAGTFGTASPVSDGSCLGGVCVQPQPPRGL